MLQQVLEADTETFETGSYERAVRVRKWLYLFSGLVFVCANGWLAAGDLANWLGLSRLPPVVIWQASSSALLYFGVQYLVLMAQLSVVYQSALSKRFGERTRARVREVELELKKMTDETAASQAQFDTASADIRARFTNAERSRDMNEAGLQKERLRELTDVHNTSLQAKIARGESLRNELISVAAADFGSRRAVVVPEIMLDAWRLLPPLAVGLVTLIAFGRLPLS